jgi:hypothetical protein
MIECRANGMVYVDNNFGKYYTFDLGNRVGG